MKKILLVSAFMAGLFTLNAQETASAERQNDIMLSPIELIAGPVINVSYERLLNENSGIGINGLFDLQNDDDYSFSQISPYYRQYFGKKYASGFFVEGFVPITMTNDTHYISYYDPNSYYSNSTSVEEKNTTVGIGIGFGGKWVAKKNIIFEASAGIARRFGLDSSYDSQITGKGMLGIGYRF